MAWPVQQPISPATPAPKATAPKATAPKGTYTYSPYVSAPSKPSSVSTPKPTATPKSSATVWPLEIPAFTNVTSEYHDPQRPNHIGIDIGVPTGTKILAPVTGVAHTVMDTSGWGRHVEITSGDYTYILGHLSDFAVQDGQTIQAGTVIGLSGGDKADPYAGNSSGPHLDITVKKNGVAIDPASIFGTQAGNAVGIAGPYYNGLPPDTPTPDMNDLLKKVSSGEISQTEFLNLMGNTNPQPGDPGNIGVDMGQVIGSALSASMTGPIMGLVRTILGIPIGIADPGQYIRDNATALVPRAIAVLIGALLLLKAVGALMSVGAIPSPVAPVVAVTRTQKVVKALHKGKQAYETIKQLRSS